MFLKIYLISLPIFIVMDVIWLSLAKNFYKQQIGYLMTEGVNWMAAVAFYLLFIAGLVVFATQPAIVKNSWVQALTLGAFFGLISYATYDLTNLATIKNWPLLVTIVDLAWGSFLGGVVSVVGYFISTRVQG